jgi:uncharacterized protein (TIGR00297 family)
MLRQVRILISYFVFGWLCTVTSSFAPVQVHSKLKRYPTNGFLPNALLTKENNSKNCGSTVARDLFALGLDAHELTASVFRSSGQVPLSQAFGINAVLFLVARKKLLSALTPAGFMHAMALGTMLWTTLGWRGWTYCVLYLILGQIVTKIGFKDKEKRGIAESRGGRRGPENVWGSAATSLAFAVLSTKEWTAQNLSPSLFLLGYVAALATKLADTFASEIGKAYGKTTFLITTLERVKPGTEGAISAEGTAAAVLGGLLLSVCGYTLGIINITSVGISTIAAFLATNAESLIGATLQGKKGFGFMTNEVVNFVNTLIGGTIAVAAGKIVFRM